MSDNDKDPFNRSNAPVMHENEDMPVFKRRVELYLLGRLGAAQVEEAAAIKKKLEEEVDPNTKEPIADLTRVSQLYNTERMAASAVNTEEQRRLEILGLVSETIAAIAMVPVISQVAGPEDPAVKRCVDYARGFSQRTTIPDYIQYGLDHVLSEVEPPAELESQQPEPST